MAVYRCDCGRELDLAAELDALPRDHMGRAATFSHVCGGCGQCLEVRLQSRGFEIGYTYFGGSLHFEPLRRVALRGLAVRRSAPDDVDVTLGARHWHFGLRPR